MASSPRKRPAPSGSKSGKGSGRGKSAGDGSARPTPRRSDRKAPEEPAAKDVKDVKRASSAKRSAPAARTSSPARARRPSSATETEHGPAENLTAAPARRLRTGDSLRPRPGESGKYVYCIIQSKEPASFGRIGIGADPTEVHTVSFEDIAAVVSDTPIEVYDPTRENVLAHERVNETVMHHHTAIPMSFGTVFKTGDDIVELLRSAYGSFRDVLQKMENKLEFGLKVLWNPDEIIRVVEKEDESLRRLREEILKQRGSTYFARMQYGRLVDSLLQERSEYYVREIFETLRPVAVASRSNKPIGDRMIMNAAFLVSRDQEADFDAKVKAIGARHPQLTFKYTGPWPPYNFVNIRLKLERARESE